MGKEFLSQEEVDALLKGVTGEPDAAPEPDSARPPPGRGTGPRGLPG